MFNKILVVCVGNICRSPMAEAMLKNTLQHAKKNYEISSAGIAAMVGNSADPLAIELMLKMGIDISGHVARQASNEILLSSDLILTMELEQQTHIENQHPSLRGRVHRLGKWSGFDIPDPYRRPKIIFEQSLILIEQGISEWKQKVWK